MKCTHLGPPVIQGVQKGIQARQATMANPLLPGPQRAAFELLLIGLGEFPSEVAQHHGVVLRREKGVALNQLQCLCLRNCLCSTMGIKFEVDVFQVCLYGTIRYA